MAVHGMQGFIEVDAEVQLVASGIHLGLHQPHTPVCDMWPCQMMQLLIDFAGRYHSPNRLWHGLACADSVHQCKRAGDKALCYA